jgi:hypothetical protein
MITAMALQILITPVIAECFTETTMATATEIVLKASVLVNQGRTIPAARVATVVMTILESFLVSRNSFQTPVSVGGMTLTVIVGRTNRIPLLMAVVIVGRVVEPRSAGLPQLLRLAEVEQPMSLEGVAGGCLAATRPTRSKGVRLVGEVAGAGAGTGRDGDRGRDRGRDRNLALFICSPIL